MFPKIARGPTGLARDRRRGFERLAATTVSALVVLLAGCSSSETGHATTSTVVTTTTSTTTTTTLTTTTTTLPVPIPVPRSFGPGWLRCHPVTSSFPPSRKARCLVEDGSDRLREIRERSGYSPRARAGRSLVVVDPALLSDLSSHYTVTVFDLPERGTRTCDGAPLAWVAGGHDRWTCPHPRAVRSNGAWLGLGGQIAMSLAERHPGIASSLVLVDTSVGGPVHRSRRRGW